MEIQGVKLEPLVLYVFSQILNQVAVNVQAGILLDGKVFTQECLGDTIAASHIENACSTQVAHLKTPADQADQLQRGGVSVFLVPKPASAPKLSRDM